MEFTRTDDKICFSDTSGIDWDTWHKTLLLFQHLGYDFQDEDEVKTYFDRHCPLQSDQSHAFLQVIKAEQKIEAYSNDTVERYNAAAKELYGTTYVPRKAGYILTDGSMLDFSEGQWKRTLDHRNIENIFEESFENHSDGMYKFMAFGNIRISGNNFFNIMSQPTKQQWDTLLQIVHLADSLYVDISNQNGYTVKHVEKEIITPMTIRAAKCEITDYFHSIMV